MTAPDPLAANYPDCPWRGPAELREGERRMNAPKRDWTRPTVEVHNMENLGGATLRRACVDQGLAVSGPKLKLAGRLLDAGLTWQDVRARYGFGGQDFR